MKDKIIAIIPARSGSRSIPNKNIKDFAGKPLIYWAARAANNSDTVKKVIISTNSAKIKNIVKDFGFKKVIIVGRSRESSLDNSPSEMALIEAAKKYTFKDLIFLQATNPFIVSPDINRAYKLYRKGGYDSVLSCVLQRRFIWKEEKKVVSPLNYDYRNRPMRQNFKESFVENGALYITSKENLLKYKNRLSGKIGIYRMPAYAYFELDEPSDWEIAEAIFLKEGLYLEGDFDFKKIKLLALDIDGVLTDGRIYYSRDGERMLKFSRIDGKGIELFLKSKRKIFVISSEDSPIAKKRLEKLKIKDFSLGVSDKWKELRRFLTRNNIALEETAFIGDDVQDLGVIQKVGFSGCPNNAVDIVKDKVDYVCRRCGGQGAVRETIDLILGRR